jgi:cell division protein FtsB
LPEDLTIIDPGTFAAFAFVAVAAVSTLSIVGAIARKIGGVRPRLGRTDAGQQEELAQLSAEVESLREEVSGLRRHVEEQAERQDFTERLLAQARERGLLQAPKEGGAPKAP